MNIAELFVNLGIKGADKTIGALTQTKKGMGELGSASIETKAAILGAMYGLERMMAISGAAGTGLVNFTALTGKSAEDLQRWQFAARQAGVSADELTGSVKGVFNSMGNMLMGKGAPEGIALLSKAVGGLDPNKYRDTFYMMSKLQEGLQKMSPEMAGIVGKSFGLGEGTIAAMRRNMFTPEMLGKANIYSNGEQNSLDKSNIAWSNLNDKIQKSFGHFNAKHGQSMVADISKIVTEVFKLAEAFEKIATKLKLFEALNEIFKGWGMIFELVGAGVDKLAEMTGGDDKKGLKKNPIAMMRDWVGEKLDDAEYFKDAEKKAISPSINNQNKSHVNNVSTTHNIVVHNVDAKDTHAVKENMRAGISHATRTSPAQRQGN